MDTVHTLEVWGDLACWTRPETKVERFSYPCCTPSGARGIFDSIYCKPLNHRSGDENSAEFRWAVTRIELLNVPSYIALRRNEVSEAGPSERTVEQWARGVTPNRFFADGVRQQRQTMALRDVRFRISARIVPWSSHRANQHHLDNQFVRRASNGKCFAQPYLGCREFVAFYKYIEPDKLLPPPCDWSADLGLMVYDIFNLSTPGRNTDRPYVSLFHAKVEKGVLEVPEWEDERVLKP